jgi:predicted alpha/beta-hydrolase family hydrolase
VTDRLDIDVSEHGRTSALAYRAGGENRVNVTLVLAHGAGAGQDSRFITQFANGLACRGVDVLTFNFLYTEQRRRIPDRTEKLEACYRAAISASRNHGPFGGNAVYIGGKSMGGRIATHLAAAAASDAAASGISGLVLLGYPLHPPGKPDQLRAAHLEKIRVPMLFVQGSRDPFGTPAELQPILERLGGDVTLHAIEGGDHSLAPPKKGPRTVDQTYGDLQDMIVDWLRRVRRGQTLVTPRSGVRLQ